MKKLILAALITLNVTAPIVPLLPLFFMPVFFWNQLTMNENRLELTYRAGKDTIAANPLPPVLFKNHYMHKDDNRRVVEKRQWAIGNRQ